MPLFGFLLIGAGLTVGYAGYLGVQPTEVLRDLFTGTPLPKRRGALTQPGTQPAAYQPQQAPQPVTPNISGSTGGIPA